MPFFVLPQTLEVWNPGQLPPPLTPEGLRVPHASIPHNPLLAEPLFLARYIEKAGTGTLDMIDLCERAGLPSPTFRQEGGQFVQVLWRPKSSLDITKSGPSRDQDGPGSGECQGSACVRGRAVHGRTPGGCRQDEPHEVQGAGYQTTARCRFY
ncbi:hypothetical protein HWN36_06350 [Methanofollis tationis]|uniref:ATP-dependent DNA helicase RecG C-terminal domain-containing protein n=1 Tax=Methanofollis tationis TaxID=81417 RepID=A0A7K4HNS3_9EURY|nr:hypothetical protein [Methanofollis tationis]